MLTRCKSAETLASSVNAWNLAIGFPKKKFPLLVLSRGDLADCFRHTDGRGMTREQIDQIYASIKKPGSVADIGPYVPFFVCGESASSAIPIMRGTEMPEEGCYVYPSSEGTYELPVSPEAHFIVNIS